MPNPIEYINRNDEAMILIEYEDGSSWSGLKSAYDKMQTEQSTPILTDEPVTKSK